MISFRNTTLKIREREIKHYQGKRELISKAYQYQPLKLRTAKSVRNLKIQKIKCIPSSNRDESPQTREAKGNK